MFDPEAYIDGQIRRAEKEYLRRKATMAKSDRWIVTSPIAELGYGYLRTPDIKFNKDGDYKQDFFLNAEDAKAFCERINKDPRAGKAKVKYTKVDGSFKFKTKQHATVKDKKTGEIYDMKPRLYYIVDGKTVEYTEDKPAPWSGSKGEVEVEVVPFEGFGGGLTLRLRAIRLHEIVEGTTGGSGDWADVSEGYTSGTKERAKVSDEDADENDFDGDEDDDSDDEGTW